MKVADASGKAVMIWDLEKGRKSEILKHPETVCPVCVSLDGQKLASGCCDRMVRVWDLKKRRRFKGIESVHVGS